MEELELKNAAARDRESLLRRLEELRPAAQIGMYSTIVCCSSTSFFAYQIYDIRRVGVAGIEQRSRLRLPR